MFNRYWNLWCRKYDPDNLELKYIRQITKIKNKTILEIGCGNGRLTRILARYAKKIIGVDNDPRMIRSAKKLTKRKNVSFKLMNALSLKFKPCSFDIVIFTWCLVCLLNKEIQALKEAKKVLKKEGFLILVEPGPNSDYGKIVAPFLPKNIEKINIKKSYEQPFKKVFGKYKAIGPIKIPYAFDNLQQAFEVFKFAIEEWHKGKIKDYSKLKLKLKQYHGIRVYESVLFYGAHK